MVQKSYGKRRRTRHKLRAKEHLTVNKMLQNFDVGDSVYIKLAPAIHNFPHPKFQGKTGKVIGKRGSSYIVEVNDMAAVKKIIVDPVHMKKHM